MICNLAGPRVAAWIASGVVACTLAGCEPGRGEGGEQISLDDLQQRVGAQGGLVVVDFWATWCGPCRTLKPVLERVVADYGDRVLLIEVDIDVNRDLARHYQVSAIPTLVAFRGGKPVGRQVGGLAEQALRDWIDQGLASGGQ